MYEYPLNTLEAVEREFNKLAAPPAPLMLDGRVIGCGLPPEMLKLDDVRLILLKRQTTPLAKDAVWAELVERAQEHGEPWTTAAVGMMLPALKKIAGDTARGFRGETVDFDSEIVEGFLSALRTADARASRIYSSLYFMARRYGQEARINADRIRGKTDEYTENTVGRLRTSATGHPDLVLARAVLEGKLSDDEAGLLGQVHLDGETQKVLVEKHGLSPYVVRHRLARAEERLVKLLSDAPPPAAA